jgi:hypothetical protein
MNAGMSVCRLYVCMKYVCILASIHRIILLVPTRRKKGGEKKREREIEAERKKVGKKGGRIEKERSRRARKRKKRKSITIAGSLVTRRIEGEIEAAAPIVCLSLGQVT